MKKIALMVARKIGIGGEPYAERVGYLLTHTHHPGREFAVVRVFSKSGRPMEEWSVVDRETGLKITQIGSHRTRQAATDAAATGLFLLDPGYLATILEKALLRRATKILKEAA